MSEWKKITHTHTQIHTWLVFSVQAVTSSYQYWRDHMPSLITINPSKRLLARLCLSTAAVARPFYLPAGHINISLPSFLPPFKSFIYSHLSACFFPIFFTLLDIFLSTHSSICACPHVSSPPLKKLIINNSATMRTILMYTREALKQQIIF